MPASRVTAERAGQPAAVRVVRLVAEDAPQYRELMLQAYEEAADAFTSTAQERAAEPLSWWQARIARADGLSESFGAIADASLVGTVALEYAVKPKTRHAALVIGMYVRPGFRGAGAARRLMQAAVAAAQARPGIQCLRLTVTEGNQAAIGLYQSIGFKAWGTEPLAILTPSGMKGKVHMFMPLPPRPD